MSNYIDKRVQRSKADLKETFLELLYEKPFDQITISEIVKKANYNRGTFYANFETKECLLEEVIQDVLEDMIVQIRHPYSGVKKVVLEDLDPNSITLFGYFKDNAKLYKLLLSDHIKVDFRYKMAKAIEKLFIREYDYKFEDKSLSEKWFYIYRSHGIAGLIIRWIEEDFSDSPEYLSEQIIKLMTTSTTSFSNKRSPVNKKPKTY